MQASGESQAVLSCAGSKGTIQLGISGDGGAYMMAHTSEGLGQDSVMLSVGQPLQPRTWYCIRASIELSTMEPRMVVEQMQFKNRQPDPSSAHRKSLDLSEGSFRRVRERPWSVWSSLSRLAPVR